MRDSHGICLRNEAKTAVSALLHCRISNKVDVICLLHQSKTFLFLLIAVLVQVLLGYPHSVKWPSASGPPSWHPTRHSPLNSWEPLSCSWHLSGCPRFAISPWTVGFRHSPSGTRFNPRRNSPVEQKSNTVWQLSPRTSYSPPFSISSSSLPLVLSA